MCPRELGVPTSSGVESILPLGVRDRRAARDDLKLQIPVLELQIPVLARDRCQSSSRTSRSPSLSAASSSYVMRPTNSPSRSGATADVCSIKT